MRAGRKNNRVEIHQLTTSKSALGSDTETWALYKTVWAEVTPVQGMEKYSGDEITSEVDTNFKIDYLFGLSPKYHRIKFQKVIYDIRAIAELGFRVDTLLTCKAQKIPNLR